MGGAAALQGGGCLADTVHPTAATWALGLTAIASGVALIVGALTPAAAALAGLSTTLIVTTWMPAAPSRPLVDGVAASLVLADAAVLVLLGPGAHSMDAYLFGRREIVIPHESHLR